jgi:hypothetical protein
MNIQLPGASMPVPSGLVDPCALLTAAEVQQITGTPLGPASRSILEDGTYVECAWCETAPTHPELGTPIDLKLEPKTDANTSYIGQGSGVDQIPGIKDAAQIGKRDASALHGAQVDGLQGFDQVHDLLQPARSVVRPPIADRV